jgi:hypothetical protein
MRATTSLPDPVGPRISTEMPDLAAVRIHSKTISIFSSRPIISRNRCTDGDWSSVLIAARRSRNASRWAGDVLALGARGGEMRRALGQPAGDAEVDELFEAVLDVETHAAEGGHQPLYVERLVRLRVQKADESGAERRLHQRAKACLGGIGLGAGGGGGALRGNLMSFTER